MEKTETQGSFRFGGSTGIQPNSMQPAGDPNSNHSNCRGATLVGEALKPLPPWHESTYMSSTSMLQRGQLARLCGAMRQVMASEWVACTPLWEVWLLITHISEQHRHKPPMYTRIRIKCSFCRYVSCCNRTEWVNVSGAGVNVC
jgi:hypothetical protein